MKGANVLVEVEFEAGTMGAVGAGVGLLAGMGEDVVSQTLVEVSPNKQLVAEGIHQSARAPHYPLQHNTNKSQPHTPSQPP